jgi:hypothetical protein
MASVVLEVDLSAVAVLLESFNAGSAIGVRAGERTGRLLSENGGSVVVVDQTTRKRPSRRRVLPAPRSLVWWRGGEEALCGGRIVREGA